MAILIIIALNKNIEVLKGLAKKTVGYEGIETIYPLIRITYDNEKNRNKALDYFRKKGYNAEIEA